MAAQEEHARLVEESASKKDSAAQVMGTAGQVCSTLGMLPVVGAGFAIAGMALKVGQAGMSAAASIERGDIANGISAAGGGLGAATSAIVDYSSSAKATNEAALQAS